MSDGRASVLFVCLGNICRSPLAEGAFAAAAARTGLDILVDSAGTGGWHVGDPPDPRARAVARGAGVPIDHLRARQVTAGDFDRFTHIFAMDRQNLADLAAIRPDGACASLALLLDAVPGREGDSVVDPYYDDALFARTWADVTAAAEALAARFADATSRLS